MAIASKTIDKKESRRVFLLEGNLWNVIFITAFPQVVSMIVDSIFNIGDTFFVSRIGDAAISAVSINDSLMMIMRSVSIGFAMGASSFISRSLGAKRDEVASKAATTTIILAMGFMTIFAVTLSFFLEPLVVFLGATESVKQYAMDYARWILPAAPITAATVCLSQTLRAEGNTTHAMIGTVSGNIIDLALNPLFIFKFGWGVAGAASSTTLAKFITMIILAQPYIKDRCLIKLRLSNFAPTKSLLAELARMGIPTMARSSMMSAATIIMNNTAASFGDTALAAVAIGNKSMRLVGSALMGFGQGFQPIAGFCWGAKRYDRVLRAFSYTLIIGAVVGGALSALLIVFARHVIMIFTSDPAIIEIGLIFIITQSAVMLPHAWSMVIVGLFQALGFPIRAAVLGLSRQLLVYIPSILLLSYFFGLKGLACAQATSDVVSFILAACFLLPAIKQLRALSRQETDAVVNLEEVALDEEAFEVSFDDD